jgi:hypothetical protein
MACGKSCGRDYFGITGPDFFDAEASFFNGLPLRENFGPTIL